MAQQTSIAVVAEKPSVARDIARVMEATKQGQGYLHGNGDDITKMAHCPGFTPDEARAINLLAASHALGSAKARFPTPVHVPCPKTP